MNNKSAQAQGEIRGPLTVKQPSMKPGRLTRTTAFGATITSETLLSTNPDGTVTLSITYDGSGTIMY